MEEIFKTTHDLPFLSKRWDSAFNFDGLQEFKIGTCIGQWTSTKETYDIISIVNDQPGNGHLEDVFEWFENSCKRDKRSLRVLACMNNKFEKHLVYKRGFTYQTDHDLIKRFKN